MEITPVSSRAAYERCLELGEKYRELREAPESKRGDTYDADRRRAAAELLEANTELDVAMRMERFALESAAWDHAVTHPEVRGPQAAGIAVADTRSAGSVFVESAQYLGDARNSGEVEVRNLLTGTSIGTSGSQAFVPVGSPFLNTASVQRQRFFVRDVLTVQSTGLASVPYIRELNAAANEGGASAVSEASAKPEVTMQFESDDAPIRKLAAWIQATEEALNDAPTLRGYIDNRLAYMLKVREEQQLLNGSGTAPQVKGIRQYSGVQTASGELYAAVGSAIGKVENVDGDADGVAVNPLDFWAAVTDRHSEGFDAPSLGFAPFGAPSPTIWGLPVIRTRAMESGKALVGAWRLGATLFDRETVTIRTSDSHASLFVSNTFVILAEERIGLAVHRPDFFCLATVTAPS